MTSKTTFEAVSVAPSSNVQTVSYFAGEKRLRVRFRSGEYEYEDVPQQVVDAWSKAESSGKFFFASVRGKFDSRKIADAEKAEDGVES